MPYASFTDIKPTEWTFKKPDTTGSQTYVSKIPMIFINNPVSKQHIIFQTAPSEEITEKHFQRCPFGVSKGQPGDPDKGVYDVVLHITNEELINKINEIDDFIGESAVKHFPQWFGKTISPQECQFMHKRILKSKAARQEPFSTPDAVPVMDYFIKVKVTGDKGNELNPKKKVTQVELCSDESCLVDGAMRQVGNLDDIIPQSRVIVALELGRLWYMDKTTRQFGVTLEAKHLIVLPCKNNGSTRGEPDTFNFGENPITGEKIKGVYVPSSEVEEYLQNLLKIS